MPLAGGIVYGEAFPCVLSVGVWMSVLLCLVGILFISYRYSFRRLYGGTVFFFLFCLGITLVTRQLQKTEYAFSNETSVYRVTLDEEPEIKERSILFHSVLSGEVQKDTFLHAAAKNVFLLYFPKDTAAYTLRRGDELLIHARLNPPVNNGNPDEFDYARYLMCKGVSGTAYVPAGHWKIIGYDESRSFRQIALDYRKKVISLYRSLGFKGDELAVLSALTVGDKDELGEDIVETYSVTGASHVLALSGLHVGFLYVLFLFILSPLWRRWNYLKPFLLLVIILLLWSFAFFTGLSSSVVRSVIMCSLLALSNLQMEKPLTMNTLAVTAFLMLLVNPVWLFDVGFQLSFAAVAAILLFQPEIYRLWTIKNHFLRKMWGLVTVSITAQIGTAPLVMLYFSRFSTHFLLTNLWVIPMVTIIMYTAVLLFVLMPFPFVQQGVAMALDTMIRVQNAVLHWIEQLPFASIDNIWIDVWGVLLFYLCFMLGYHALTRRTVTNAYIALFALMLSTSYHTFTLLSYVPRRSLEFYNVRGCPAVHCLADNANSWLVCADSLPNITRLQRALSPHWNHLRLEQPVLVTGDFSIPEISVHNQIVSYGGKHICLLADSRWRSKQANVPISIDYLYISKGYKGDIKELTSLFTVETVVLDSSLSDFYQDKIINDCIRLGIPYLSLSKKGSIRILL